MKKDRNLSVCPKVEEGRHRLPAPPGREGILMRCSSLEAESWLPRPNHTLGRVSQLCFVCVL